MRTKIVHLHGTPMKLAIWAIFGLLYLLCVLLALWAIQERSLAGLVVAGIGAVLNSALVLVFLKGFFELHGNEYAQEEWNHNPTDRVFSHGWGWLFWPMQSIRRFEAKDSYRTIAFAARSRDNVAFTGAVVTAARASAHIAQRDGEFAGSSRWYNVESDAARLAKADQSAEQVAEWVLSGVPADAVHGTHEVQNLLFAARLRLAEFDEVMQRFGADPNRSAECFDAVNNNKVYREELIKLVKDEDPGRDFSRFEYNAAEEYLPGCAFKDRQPSKDWAAVQEKKAAMQARIDAYRDAADAARAAGATVPADHALAMAGDLDAFVFVGEGGKDVWKEVDLKGKKGKGK